MQLDRLTAESVIMPFDCGDDDLNAFRFITVDAYLSAIPFYEKNDFRLLVSVEENPYTRSMYFDMMEMEENTE